MGQEFLAQGETAKAPVGMSMLQSLYGPRETADRLVDAVAARHMTVFARIDHGAGALEAGLMLRATELLIFGSARAGTALMQAAQTAGIDLPLKALIWVDEVGITWLGYNDPYWLVVRHGGAAGQVPVLHVMGETLAAMAQEATGSDAVR